MLDWLDIFYTIFKICFLITFITLTSTALGVEFGVTRLYVRFVEAILNFGQDRIKKAESEHKIISASYDDEDDEDSNEDDDDAIISKQKSPQKSKPIKTKRLSPDEPPVFLLGDNCDQGQHEFQLEDASGFVVSAIQSIISDDVTQRFQNEKLRSWNLLTRTNIRNYQFTSAFLAFFWFVGFIIRYCILLPLRIMFTFSGICWLTFSMAVVGYLPNSIRNKLYWHNSLMSFRMLSTGITATLEFHNRQYRAKEGDICVANHTSPIDVVILACDNVYALVGQRHVGFLGMLEKVLSTGTNHVWFDRGEMHDRQLVVRRMKEHVSCKNLPILIFPEGTCINNSAVMMFKKGSFEITDRVCPVAIKYDARFGDPFWNSSKQSYVQYLLLMMSSWLIKCEVWYLPPMERLPDESSAEFASRVKAEIARQGGLKDLAWDGQLKRSAPKEIYKTKQQELFARMIKIE